MTLVLASSSTNNTAKTFSLLECDSGIDIHSSEKGPLVGINLDLFHIQEIHDKEYKQQPLVIVKSSHAQGKLLSKKQIMNKIKYFPWYSCCGGSDDNMFGTFIFTGHGAVNGDLIIETKQHPTGQRLTIQEIIRTIEIGAQSFTFNLTIILDSCYSGMNAYRLEKMDIKLPGFIYLRTSSGPNYTSLDVYRFGGLEITNGGQMLSSLNMLVQRKFVNQKRNITIGSLLLSAVINKKYKLQLELDLIFIQKCRSQIITLLIF